MSMHEFVKEYLKETILIAETIEQEKIAQMADALKEIKQNKGRLFILGVGGSAANASHAVNDFRKIAGIETYAPTDNVSEITARTNDEGWETVFIEYLRISQLNERDAVIIFSVGGGSESTSQNLVKAMHFAKERKSKILSIVSRDGGEAAKLSDICTLVPVVNEKMITPHAEGWQGVIWHLLVNAIR